MVELRTPKGTIDYTPSLEITKNDSIERVIKIFRKHNAVPISTPMFELRSILMNKYGDDAKLIYNLEDQGGDICSLRYDLTVPFSRYLASNRINKLRKYQVGNVFRRDNPSFKTGRLREFVQADFDICGDNVKMVYDTEILKVISEIFEEFKEIEKDYIIRINDRRIISSVLYFSSIDEPIHGTICSTIDKIDKLKKEELIKEFHSKGLNDEQVSLLLTFLEIKGTNLEILDTLLQKSDSFKDRMKDDQMKIFYQAIDELKSLLRYVINYEINNVVIDLSLARGLEYYTGIIIEGAYKDIQIGSIIGGGRYDNLCNSISNHSVPCVGFSVGITRLLSILPIKSESSAVFVGSAFGLLLEQRMKILNDLWKNGIQAETFSGIRVNYKDQINYAKKNSFEYALFTGEQEYLINKISVVNVITNEKTEMNYHEIISYLKSKLKLN